MEEILAKYIHEKRVVNPLNGMPIPQSKRIATMYAIVQNTVYYKKYTMEERILASVLITQILKEKQP
jgi:hypothetical protein